METAENIEEKIHLIEQEVETYENLHDYMLLYIPTVVVPTFKTMCSTYYFKFLQNFASNHIEHSCESVRIWSQLNGLCHGGDSEESEEEEDNENMLQEL